MSGIVDISGHRFGRLLAVEKSHHKKGTWYWHCICDCGQKVVVVGATLRSGATKSCGCFRKEIIAKNQKRPQHGHCINGKITPEYHAWAGMLQRCVNPSEPSYRNYGARGITVCDHWRDSFENFLADMGPRPSSRHSIDRHPDNNGNYEPTNCRWATSTEQGNNKRTNRLVTIDGENLSFTNAVRKYSSVGIRTARGRVGRGWSDQAAIFTPVS